MIGYYTRLKLVAWSGAAGWLGGYFASLPAEAWIGLRDGRGDARLMLQTLMMGLAVWAVWTSVLALGAWLLVALPCTMLLAPAMLVRFRRRVLLWTVLCATGLSMAKMWAYRDTAASRFTLKFVVLLPYGLFAVGFAVVTAWLYLRLVHRRLAAG